jgi:LDH2 family malate/lactate/ureidoglycolate dehydrogenase
MNDMRIPCDVLSERVANALIACGVATDRAAVEAAIMVEADLFGTPSHGVRMLPGLLKALRQGRAKAMPNVQTVRGFAACAVLDCDNGPGRSTSLQAMEIAVGNAQRFGVGICLAQNTTHWGRAHAYVMRAAQQGMIGICTTNAMPTMAAFGARRAVIGNNPLAIGIPSANVAEPIVLDMAMSQAAVGKVNTWLREGHELPQGWGLDVDGNPTNDAKAILAGAVLPMGGHKGSSLAMMMEIMTAALAGGLFGFEIVRNDASGLDPDSTKFFLAINPEAFGGTGRLRERVSTLVGYLQENSGEREPFLWPGQRGWDERRRNLADGVPLHVEIVEQLRAEGLSL